MEGESEGCYYEEKRTERRDHDSQKSCFIDDQDVWKAGAGGRKKGKHNQWSWCSCVSMKGQEDLSRETTLCNMQQESAELILGLVIWELMETLIHHGEASC